MSESVSPNPEVAKTEKRVMGLKETNQKMIEGIESTGARVNLGEPRVERMMHWLQTKGIITYEDQLDEQLQWELHLRSQLQPAFEQVKRAIQMAGVPQQTQSGLIVPGVNAPRNIKG